MELESCTIMQDFNFSLVVTSRIDLETEITECFICQSVAGKKNPYNCYENCVLLCKGYFIAK